MIQMPSTWDHYTHMVVSASKEMPWRHFACKMWDIFLVSASCKEMPLRHIACKMLANFFKIRCVISVHLVSVSNFEGLHVHALCNTNVTTDGLQSFPLTGTAPHLTSHHINFTPNISFTTFVKILKHMGFYMVILMHLLISLGKNQLIFYFSLDFSWEWPEPWLLNLFFRRLRSTQVMMNRKLSSKRLLSEYSGVWGLIWQSVYELTIQICW